MKIEKTKIKRSEFEDIVGNLIKDEIHRNLEEGGFDAFLTDFLSGSGYSHYSKDDKEKEISLLEKFENLCEKLGFEKDEDGKFSNYHYEKILHIDRKLYDEIEKAICKNHRESYDHKALKNLEEEIEEEYEIEEDMM